MKLNLTLREQFACFKRVAAFVLSNALLVLPLLLLSCLAYDYTGVMSGFMSIALWLVIFAVYISKAYIGDTRAFKSVLFALLPFFIVFALGSLFSEVLNYFSEPFKLESSEGAGSVSKNHVLVLMLFLFGMALIFTIMFMVQLSLFVTCILKVLLCLQTALTINALVAMFPAILKISAILSILAGIGILALHESRFEILISVVNLVTSLYLVECAAALINIPRKPKEKKRKKAALKPVLGV